MRAVVLAVCIALGALGGVSTAYAGHYQANGTFTGHVSRVVIALFHSFPNGGQGLADAIAELLTKNPGLADDVAYYASTHGSPAQQAAAGLGMGQAVANLNGAGNSGGADQVAHAVELSGNAIIQTAANLGGGTGGFAAGLFLSPNSPVTTGANCTTNTVSPAAPSTTCQ